jgi:hypothetical protein
MAKDEDLDIVVSSIQRASRKGDQPAQEQVDEGEEHGSSLPSERPDPTEALLTGLIRVFCALHGRWLGRADAGGDPGMERSLTRREERPRARDFRPATGADSR